MNPITSFGERGMISDKVVVRHAVAIKENNIVTMGFGDCAIQNDSLPEVMMFLPAMTDRKCKSMDAFLNK